MTSTIFVEDIVAQHFLLSARARTLSLAKAREQTAEYLKSEKFEAQLRGVANALLKDHVRDRIVFGLAGAGASETTNTGRTEIKEE